MTNEIDILKIATSVDAERATAGRACEVNVECENRPVLPQSRR